MTQIEAITNQLAMKLGKPVDVMSRYVADCIAAGTYPCDIFGATPVGPPQVGAIYQLNNVEIKLCEFLGPMRTKAARASGKKNMIQCAAGGSNEEREKEIDGLQAELLYGKVYNLFPSGQLQIKPRNSVEDVGDYPHLGYIVDVKHSRYDSARLTLSHWKHAQNIDFLCLFTGVGGRFTFRGFFTAKELVQEHRFKCLPGRNKPQYLASQNELLTLEAVLAKL